ncbi:MAG: cupin domain-containing protein [Gemmataceae bacterium]
MTATIDYHVHMHMDETLVVLEGEIEFNVNGTKFLRKAGSVAFVPRGVHHGFEPRTGPRTCDDPVHAVG